jgi:hypothetical protein
MEIHSPDNTFLIENIWAFCSKDEGGKVARVFLEHL